MYEFIFILPPSVNALYGGGSKQRRFKSKAYRAWEQKAHIPPALKLNKVHVEYYITFPDNRIRDSKNYLKAIDDWLVKHGTITDDSFKVLRKETIIPMPVDKNNPHIKVVLHPI